MNTISCRLCQSEANFVFESEILRGRFKVNYFQCSHCELLQTTKPYWLEEAYQDSIAITDTGILGRNYRLLDIVLRILTLFAGEIDFSWKSLFASKRIEISCFQGKYLDYGGGYGIFVRLLRDVGINAFWIDQFSKNLFANGFEFNPNENYEAISAFELVEHFDEPYEEFRKILRDLKPDIFIFSTTLYGVNIPDPSWWYYSFESGQHIAFYSNTTLNWIAKKFSYYFFCITDDVFIFTKSRDKGDIIVKNFHNPKLLNIAEVKRMYVSKTFSDHLHLKNCFSS